jgi:hypothetical protein
MPDETEPQAPPDGPYEQPWDPHKIMRDRAAATRQDRDQSLAELRSGMDDDEIRDELGIDLGEIES